jgi:hypothetical protein
MIVTDSWYREQMKIIIECNWLRAALVEIAEMDESYRIPNAAAVMKEIANRALSRIACEKESTEETK